MRAFSNLPPKSSTSVRSAWQPVGLRAPAHALQPKLEVGAVDDPLEREADRVAEQVMRMPIGATLRRDDGSALRRTCQACADDESATGCSSCGNRLSRKASGAVSARGAGSVPSIVDDVLHSPGRPLDAATREYFEPRFGHDFSRVRVHTSEDAGRSAEAVDALAYTVGTNIAFASGNYAPTENRGRRLLAHELSHVVQQGGALRIPSPGQLSRESGECAARVDADRAPAPVAPSMRRRVLRRQPKKGSPWADWWPPHVKPVFPDAPFDIPGTKDALDACKRLPSLPGCSQICKLYDCSKPSSSKTLCPPGFVGSTATDFKDQCCKENQPASTKNCCPVDRMGDGRCCLDGEASVDGHCVKGDPIDLTRICVPPGRKAPSGACCLPPKVPGAFGCEDSPAAPKPLIFDEFVDRFSVLFKQGEPRPAQSFESSLAAGRGELDQAIDALKKDLSTGAQLVANASHEGVLDRNMDLTDRRLTGVRTEMSEVSWKIRDPSPSLADVTGCRGTFGAYSCGIKNADPDKVEASDRNVMIRLFRPKELKWPITGP